MGLVIFSKTQRKLQDGADGGGRTHTLSRVPDFESGASASSATSATVCQYILSGGEVNKFPHVGRQRASVAVCPAVFRPPLRNTHCLCQQKQKGTARNRPDINHTTMSPHRLWFRWSNGAVVIPGLFVTRRRGVRTKPAWSRSHGRCFLPLIKLLRRKDGFHLLDRFFHDNFAFGLPVFLPETGWCLCLKRAFSAYAMPRWLVPSVSGRQSG